MEADLTESDLRPGAVIRDGADRTTYRLTRRSEAGAARGGTGGRWRARVLRGDWKGLIAPGSFVTLPPDAELLRDYELTEE